VAQIWSGCAAFSSSSRLRLLLLLQGQTSFAVFKMRYTVDGLRLVFYSYLEPYTDPTARAGV